MTTQTIVSPEESLAARRELLSKEKSALQQLDAVAMQRRELPWVRVTKDYRFQTDAGEQTLKQLFGNNSQLIVYHFMFGPGWNEGCTGCSFMADHFDGANLHLKHHDVSLVAVSRAPLSEFRPFQQRMGWQFPWVSSCGSDFNFDFGVSFRTEDLAAGTINYNYEEVEQVTEEMPGVSVFAVDDSGDVFHTYSSYARGLELLLGTHMLLDLTPRGRNEQTTMDWVRHHDRYETAENGLHGRDTQEAESAASQECCQGKPS